MAGSVFRTWDFFLVRAGLLAGDPGPAGGLAARVLAGPAQGRQAYLELIRSVGADARLREAVAVATPSLDAIIDQVEAGKAGGLRDAQLRRAALALLRYSIRMHTRPTPFGLFAGVSCGEFGDVAKFRRGGADRTHTDLDMGWLLTAVKRLEEDTTLLSGLRVQAHQAVVTRADRVILEVPSMPGAAPGEEARSAVSVRDTPVVREALRLAGEPIVFSELAGRLTARFGGRGEQVRGLLQQLVSSDILLTSLRPPLDGTDPLVHVIQALGEVRRGDNADRLLEELRAVDRLRREYDAARPGEGREVLARLRRRARQIQRHDNPVHVTTRLDLEIQLPSEVRGEVERAAQVLWRLSPPGPGTAQLRRYHTRFLERYGTDRLVPLLEALDENTGLGTPHGYMWPVSESDDPVAVREDPGGPGRELMLSRLLMRAVREGRREVVVDETTLIGLAQASASADAASVPDSGELYVHVVAPSPDELTGGNFLVVLAPGMASPHAGAAFGRFAELVPGLRGRLERELRAVPAHVAGALPAEIAFMPRSGRAANVAHTAACSGSRITVGLPDSARLAEIRLRDIAVGADRERLYAVHLPTGREFAPMVSNKLNMASQAPNVCRFLYDLGLEGQRLWQPWDWGPMAASPFLPRVRYGRVVLAPATWRVDELRNASGDWAATVARWQQAWAVPQHVLAVSGDQRLLLDLADLWQRELLRDEVRKNTSLVVQEVPGEVEGWLTGTVGGHAIELVVPVTRCGNAPRRGPYTARAGQRHEPGGLGTQWLYLKVYGARRGQEDFLRNQVPELVQAAIEHGADRWFFVRYADAEGHHLRVRFHGDTGILWAAVAPRLGDMLRDWQRQGLVCGHSTDQYDPELERYGGQDAREAAELVFQQDSMAALALLRLAKKSGCPYSIDALTAISVAALAHAFGAPPGPRPEVADGYTTDAAVAWLSLTGFRQDLPEDYRREQAWWRRLIDPAGGWPALGESESGTHVLAALRDRDEAVKAFAERIRAGSPTPAARIVTSLMHMTCNRLIGGSPDRELKILGIARGAVEDNDRRRRHAR
jgi:lantibiotic biosynthesis protein